MLLRSTDTGTVPVGRVSWNRQTVESEELNTPVRKAGFEPARSKAQEPKSCVSANFTTPASTGEPVSWNQSRRGAGPDAAARVVDGEVRNRTRRRSNLGPYEGSLVCRGRTSYAAQRRSGRGMPGDFGANGFTSASFRAGQDIERVLNFICILARSFSRIAGNCQARTRHRREKRISGHRAHLLFA